MTPAGAEAAYDLTVSNAPTFNAPLIGDEYAATGLGANVNAGELSAELQSGSVIITTGATGGQPGTVTISEPIGATAQSALTIDAGSTVTIDAPIQLGGGALIVASGRTTVIATTSIDVAEMVDFSGPVLLTSDVTITAARPEFMTVDGPHALTVLAPAGAVNPYAHFEAAVGATTPLSALTVTMPELRTTGDMRTTGTQRYNGTVLLDTPGTTFTASVGAVVFNGVVRDEGLVVTAAGGASFLADLSIPSLEVNGGTATVGASRIEAIDSLVWNAPVRLETDTIMHAGSGDPLTFANTVDGPHSLSLEGPATATIGGTVGGSSPLTALTARGLLAIDTARITTTGQQRYQREVTAAQSTMLESTFGSVIFEEDLASTAAVAVAANSLARFERDVSVATLDTRGSTLTLLAGLNVQATTALHLGNTQLLAETRLNLPGSATMTSHGTFDINAQILRVTGTATFAGTVTGSGNFNFQGPGSATLTFSGTSTYSAETYVTAGSVIAASTTGLSPNTTLRLPTVAGSALVVQSATATVGSITGGNSTGGAIMLGANSLTVGADNTSTSFDGNITGIGQINKTGTGTWTYTGSAGFTGTVRVDGGVLDAPSVTSLPNASAVELVSPGTLVARSLELDQLTGTGTLTGAALDVTVDNAVPVTFGGTVGGGTDLIATGTARFTLAGVSTSSGTVTVDAGATLVLGSATALPLAPRLTVDGVLDVAATTLTPAQLAGTGVVTSSSTGNVLFDVAAPTTVNAALTGNLALTKRGTGALTVASANTYTGATNVDAGSLVATAPGALPSATELQVAAGAGVDVSAADAQLRSLRGAGVLVTGSAARTVTLTAPSALGWSGTVTGAGTIDLPGGGISTLSGASPSFTGTFTLDAGVFDLTGSAPSASVSLQGAQLRGMGSIGAVAAAGSSDIAPGLTSIDTLRTGSLTLGSGATIRMDVIDRTMYDRLLVAGAVQLGGASLQLGSATALPASTTITLVDNDGSDAIVGTFADLPEGATLSFGGASHLISYVGGSGNDVTLSNVPASVTPDPSAPSPTPPTSTTPKPDVTTPKPDDVTPAPRPLNVVLGLDRYVAYARRSLQLRMAATQPGALRVQILRGRQLVSTRYLRVVAGRSTKSVRSMPTAPGIYTVRVTVTTADGATDTDTARLVVRALPRVRR